jgi:hypothetical protein
MKKIIFYLFLLFFILSIPVLGQTPVNGDYRSLQSGNWNIKENWEKYNGSTWIAASEFPPISGLTKKVTIVSGHIIDATNSITSNSGTAEIFVATNGTLNMGTYGIRGTSTSTRFNKVTIDGTLNTTSLVNSVTFTVDASGTFVTSYVGSSGWWYISASPTTVTLDGIVEFNGGPNQLIPSYPYSEIIVSGTDPKTITGQVDVTDLLTINSNATLEVNAILAVAGTISLHGILQVVPSASIDVVNLNIYTTNGLILQSDASTSASLIISGDLNGDINATGSIQANLNLPATSWHYISPPVSSVGTSMFSTGGVRNVTLYDESYITTDMNNGWVNYEGYHYNTSTSSWELVISKAWTTLLAGHGYNYYNSSSATYSFQVNTNTANTPVTLKYASGGAGTSSVQGYNLIGNPFTSGIDWDIVVTDPLNTGAPGWSSVEQAIYFRNGGNLIIYNGGVTNPNSYNEFGNFIPPMQGFFIKSNVNDFELIIPSAAKTHTSNLRYKGTTIIPLVRLEIENSGKTDQTVVRFDDKATILYDNSFDARKLFPDANLPSIASSLGGTDYSINGIPFPESSISIPLVINAPVSGSYVITAKEIKALESYNVSLKDISQNLTINLSDISAYTFSSSAGKYTDRFILTISNLLTAISENKVSDIAFNIFSGTDILNIQTLSSSWDGIKGLIKVFDITGRQVLVLNNIEFYSGDLKQIPVNFQKGAYIVEITSAEKRFVGKVMIK